MFQTAALTVSHKPASMLSLRCRGVCRCSHYQHKIKTRPNAIHVPMLNSNLKDQAIQAFCAEKSSKFDHTTCQTWQRQKCSKTGHQPRKTFEGLSVKRRRRDCRSETFEKLLARSVLAMHEEAAELAKPNLNHRITMWDQRLVAVS